MVTSETDDYFKFRKSLIEEYGLETYLKHIKIVGGDLREIDPNIAKMIVAYYPYLFDYPKDYKVKK